MRKRKHSFLCIIAIQFSVLFLLINPAHSQGSIDNTLGSGGSFNVKNSTTTFLSISGANGRITLPLSNNAGMGTIYKGSAPFLHDYKPSAAAGNNLFIGTNAGNFTMFAGSATEASRNTGVGYNALMGLTYGFQNSAFGASALYSITWGHNNSAFGNNALFANTSGDHNSAFGTNALYTNSTGYENSAFGAGSLYKNTTGNYNSAFGYNSMYENTNGNGNTACGYASLNFNSSGNQNTAFGSYALWSTTTGSNNTAIGNNAGRNITTGTNNITIGYNAQPSHNFINNEVTIGNSSNNSYRMYASGWTNASDAKYKHDIESLPVGLDFVKQLRPVQYVYNHAANEEKSYGFIAQEVKAVVEENGLEKSGLVQPMDAGHLGLKTTELIPILTKAIQEQQAQIEKQQQEIEELKRLVGKRKFKKKK